MQKFLFISFHLFFSAASARQNGAALCREYAKIIKGSSTFNRRIGECSAVASNGLRRTLIEGRESHFLKESSFIFEGLDKNGNALNFARLSLLEQDVQKVIQILRSCNPSILVASVSTPWLFTRPQIKYILIQAVAMNPLQFARVMRAALQVIRK